MIELGGNQEERLYLHEVRFVHKGEDVWIKKTDMPNIQEIISRHKGRYHLGAFYMRYGMNVLDFPCGSGYGLEIIGEGTNYHGRDIDPVTIEYCRKIYCNSSKTFDVGDMTKPVIQRNHYDIIMCIEGLEHIEGKYQASLIEDFYKGLKKGGRLIISSPLSQYGESEKSRTNPYHLWELSELDFIEMVEMVFDNVQFIKETEILHNGEKAEYLYAICRKGE